MSGFEPAFLDQVLERLSAETSLAHDAVAQSLRLAFPGTHISVCSEDDISPRLTPVAENAAGQIFLVARGEHCLSLTNDAAAATGIVVALRGDEA